LASPHNAPNSARRVWAPPFFGSIPGAAVWTVKNLFELKNARNVVVDGNVVEMSLNMPIELPMMLASPTGSWDSYLERPVSGDLRHAA
jgi:hypothetical protein